MDESETSDWIAKNLQILESESTNHVVMVENIRQVLISLLKRTSAEHDLVVDLYAHEKDN